MDGAHHWVSVTTVLVADGTSSHTRPVVCVGRPAPPGVEPSIPFRVVRSRFGNLPVYLDYKSGGSRVLTIVRKVEGDAVVSGVCGLLYDRVPQHSLKGIGEDAPGTPGCEGSVDKSRQSDWFSDYQWQPQGQNCSLAQGNGLLATVCVHSSAIVLYHF